jgi:hypothetical protein
MPSTGQWRVGWPLPPPDPEAPRRTFPSPAERAMTTPPAGAATRAARGSGPPRCPRASRGSHASVEHVVNQAARRLSRSPWHGRRLPPPSHAMQDETRLPIPAPPLPPLPPLPPITALICECGCWLRIEVSWRLRLLAEHGRDARDTGCFFGRFEEGEVLPDRGRMPLLRGGGLWRRGIVSSWGNPLRARGLPSSWGEVGGLGRGVVVRRCGCRLGIFRGRRGPRSRSG